MPDYPYSEVSLDSALEQLERHCQQDFPKASPIPPALNHSRAFHAREVNRIFKSEWICVGRSDEIRSSGDYLTYEIAQIPVLLVRQSDGDIKGFVNACAHRFACLVPESKGRAKKFTCRYHGWTYKNDGQLVAAPHMQMNPSFEIADHGLKEIQVSEWEGFLYVCLAENPQVDLHTALSPLTQNIVGRYDMGCYQTVLREEMQWSANWKNLVENFTESYHVPVAHGKTFANAGKPIEEYVTGEDSLHYCYHYAPQEADTGSGAAHRNNTRLEGEWRRMMVDFCIFPNHLITLMPDYVWYISVQPAGADQFNAMWGVAVPPEILEDVEDKDFDKWLGKMKTFIDVANNEDKVLVEALHKGSRSPLLPRGAYHPIERNLWQFTQYLHAKCGNS